MIGNLFNIVQGDKLKLNIGCGFNKIDGFINIDKFDECKPDLKMDAEITPWLFNENEIDEVFFIHSLEHMGADANVFFAIIKELYRVCKPGAIINIKVPHPRHDDFINDPTHVRIITPELFSLFSKKENIRWKDELASNSLLALYLDVDFEIKENRMLVEPKYMELFNNKEISEDDLNELIKECNNIAKEYELTLKVIK